MAHKKAGGSSKNGRDSNSKRLGVKRFGGELVKPLVATFNLPIKVLSKRRQLTSFLSNP
jgi:hypothetical protein